MGSTRKASKREVGESSWAIVEPIWEHVSIYGGPKRFRSQLSKVPRRAQVLFAVHWFHSEVCNGGLEQFFSNSTGVLGPEAVLALRALGLRKSAAVAASALRLYPSPYPRHRRRRQQLLEHIEPDVLGRLDDQLFFLFEREGGGSMAAADRFAAGVGESRP